MNPTLTRYSTAALLAAGWIATAPAPAKAGMLDWMQEHAAGLPGSPARHKPAAPADDASLLTLEPGQTELYPKPSPDGRFLLTLTQKGKQAWISRRYAENGDPANVVTEDVRAFDSFEWEDNDHVSFLSTRAGGLGLWDKIADGEGMVRRLMALHGRITQPVRLKDGAVIAVRLVPARVGKPGGVRRASRMHGDGFNSWRFPGFRTEIVRIEPDGSVRRLAEGVNPALSPDGQWVVFSMPVGRSQHLFRMHPDGSGLIQVTSARSVDAQPAWSRDGKWILFTSNRAHPDMRGKGKSNWDIWAIQPDGRNLIRLTADRARDGAPRMGGDGQVYFHSDRAVPKAEQQAREVRRVARGFHVWRIRFPSAK